jgi:hypothetical protein
MMIVNAGSVRTTNRTRTMKTISPATKPRGDYE